MKGCFGWLLAVWVNEIDNCGVNDSNGVCHVCSYFQVAGGQLFEILVLVNQSVNADHHEVDFSTSVSVPSSICFWCDVVSIYMLY